MAGSLGVVEDVEALCVNVPWRLGHEISVQINVAQPCCIRCQCEAIPAQNFDLPKDPRTAACGTRFHCLHSPELLYKQSGRQALIRRMTSNQTHTKHMQMRSEVAKLHVATWGAESQART